MSDKDRIRDMVMALSRGDHDEATAAATEVIAAKTAKIVSEAGWDGEGDPRMGNDANCDCGSGEEAWWEDDARGIPLARVCDQCKEEKLGGFRQDVRDDPNYWADEPIEPDEEW
jgi:hypothetical protein